MGLKHKFLFIVSFGIKAVYRPLFFDSANHIVFVVPDGTLFTAEHSLSLKMEGLEKPKRKRGRPPKPRADPEQTVPATEAITSMDKETEQALNESMEQDDGDDDGEDEGEGRRRRRKKIPRRYLAVVLSISWHSKAFWTIK